jgi:hypothetical protein
LNPTTIGPLTNAQIVALICISIGAAGWLWLRVRTAPSSRNVPH